MKSVDPFLAKYVDTCVGVGQNEAIHADHNRYARLFGKWPIVITVGRLKLAEL